MVLAYLVVFVLAATPFFEVVSVIPLGVVAGLNTFAVAVAGVLSHYGINLFFERTGREGLLVDWLQMGR